jgi:hypothetical protein
MRCPTPTPLPLEIELYGSVRGTAAGVPIWSAGARFRPTTIVPGYPVEGS